MTAITLRPSLSTYISSWYPEQNFSSSNALFAGRFMQEGDIYRSLLQFNLDNIPLVAAIHNAWLNVNMYNNQVGMGGAHIRVQRLFNRWSQGVVNWINQPSTSPGGFDRVWDGSVYIAPSASNGSISIELGDLVRGWVDGSVPNYGVQLAGNELENSLFRFWSPNYTFSYAGPRLTIDLDLGLLGIYDRQNLLIPGPPARPNAACAPIDLSPHRLATFLLHNTSSSTRVEARLEVGAGAKFKAAGPWHSLEACGSPGASVALSTAYPTEQARVQLRGAGGEIVIITPYSRE